MAAGALPDHGQAVFQDLGEREAPELQLHPPGLHLREIQDVINERQEVSPAVEDILEILLLLGVEVAEEAFEEYLGEADDGVERRAELVRHAGQELGLVAVGGLELLVEPPQLSFIRFRLVARVPSSSRFGHRHALGEIARCDLPRAARPSRLTGPMSDHEIA